MLGHILFVESVGKYWYIYETRILNGLYTIKPSEFIERVQLDHSNLMDYKSKYLHENMIFRKDL